MLSLFILLADKLKARELSLLFADLGWLLILGIVCTVFSFVLSVQLVKKISPNSFVMAVNLEPIYAILLALLIWPESETMSEGFYLGGGDCCPDDFSQLLLSEEEMVFRHWLC